MRGMKTTTTRPIDPWYLQQEKRIEQASREAAQARGERRRLFSPGHLYVVLFDSGVVKVGKTENVEARFKAHSMAGFVHATWASSYHLGTAATERDLITICTNFGTLHGGREYFTGIEVRHAVAYASLVVENNLQAAYLNTLVENDRKRREYVDRLIEAVDGDLSVTWQDAHHRAYGEDVAE